MEMIENASEGNEDDGGGKEVGQQQGQHWKVESSVAKDHNAREGEEPDRSLWTIATLLW